jgi:hypothetical protein
LSFLSYAPISLLSRSISASSFSSAKLPSVGLLLDIFSPPFFIASPSSPISSSSNSSLAISVRIISAMFRRGSSASAPAAFLVGPVIPRRD